MLSAFNRRYRLLSKTANFVADVFSKTFFLSFPNKWSSLVSTRLNKLFYIIPISEKKIRLLSNNELLLYRSKTFHSKEPETNEWISGIPSDGVFYDVGANVGIYTVFASIYARKVYAFEPVSLNYSILNQNLMANSLDKVAIAYCLAISDDSMFDTMRLSSDVVGSAHHTFGADIDSLHNTFSPVFKQGSLSISLDQLVFEKGFECPTYIKIDVDGNEHLVIAGARKMLKDERLKSILIEVNKDLELDKKLIETIIDSGFVLTTEGHEETAKGMRVGNLIFFRQ